MSNQNDQSTQLGGTPAWGTRRGPVVPYVPALDGLRALAVIAVIVYHANHQWLGGGFLGVEVFFVISGYLITLLLIAERERSGTVSLGNFWMRRARRLLPALFTLLLGTTVYCALFDRDRLGMLRGDVVGGVLYVSNWFQIWSGSSYTSAFAFAPLRHLWSLAVEEQYYIVWPLVMFVLLRRIRPKTLPILGLVFTAVAIAIAVATAMIYHPGPIDTFATTPEQFMSIFGHRVVRVDFLYLGTITRASGLLLGAALATMWRPWALRRGRAGSNANGLDMAGVLAVVALGFMCWKFREVVEVADVGISGYDLLYRGGFIAVGLATVVAIATVTHPRSRLGKYVIGTPLLVWLGKRSYGLYLYHWTVFQAYRKAAGNSLDVREFFALMAITVVLTEASYQFIETPIRTGKALATYRSWRKHGGTIRGPLGVVLGTLAVVPVFSVVSMAGARVMPDDITAGLNDNEGAVTRITTTTVGSGVTTVPLVPTTTLPRGKMEAFAVGDSVMLGSAKKLKSYGITVDAAKNRQVIDAVQIFNYYKSVNELGDVVVIHLGTNGITKAATFERILKPLANVKRVVILTMRVPRHASEQLNNAVINNLPATHPNVTILDWYTLSKPHPEWFNSDGIHPNAVGQDNYVALILQAIGR
jgi:peptidoglycan/LPS O-acetylase OafA/YrhL/lysophospholipase L1-like esterase